MTYPFPNFNGCTVEVWRFMNKFIPHLTRHVVTYPCSDLNQSILLKGTPGPWRHQCLNKIVAYLQNVFSTFVNFDLKCQQILYSLGWQLTGIGLLQDPCRSSSLTPKYVGDIQGVTWPLPAELWLWTLISINFGPNRDSQRNGKLVGSGIFQGWF